ncbi:MAG: hypothetical protein RI984_797 [Pseudomonadota bacterium]
MCSVCVPLFLRNRCKNFFNNCEAPHSSEADKTEIELDQNHTQGRHTFIYKLEPVSQHTEPRHENTDACLMIIAC